MKTAPTIFNFENNSIRVIKDGNGDPWFSAKEVCDVLGYGNPRQALESHVDVDDVQKLDTLTQGGVQKTNHINESGMYALVFGSTKDEAKRFKRWVTHEVLPAIRKTGSYSSKPSTSDYSSAIEATKLIPAMVRAARSLGLDKNAAAISANQAVKKLTGANVMQLLGQTGLTAERGKHQ